MPEADIGRGCVQKWLKKRAINGSRFTASSFKDKSIRMMMMFTNVGVLFNISKTELLQFTH